MPDDPLVVTATLDDATTARFERERRALFPPGRTAVGAHLTLFHAVPGRLLGKVVEDLERAATREAVEARVTEVRSLGRGAAYAVDAPAVLTIHRALQESWWGSLTRQDREPRRLHVTVQNKAEPDVARRTVARLRADFAPFPTTVTGLALWWYRGGPWELERELPFQPPGTP